MGTRHGQWLRLLALGLTGWMMTNAIAGEEPPRIPDHRMAGWHRTMVTVNETVPNTGVFTYLTQQRTAVNSNVLVKFAPSVEGSKGAIGATGAEDIVVEDFPGGVTAEFTLGDARVTTEITPLFIGRGTMACEGAALYTVRTDPPAAVTVGIGGPGEQSMGATPDLRRDTLVPMEALSVDGARAIFISGREKLHAGIAASAPLAIRNVEGGRALAVTFDEGTGSIVLAYGDDDGRVDALLELDGAAERARVDAYYAQLLRQHIDTPEDALDQAFRSALYNLEYNWNEPYGWNECIHHWLAIWHNQHTAGAEWIGQEDRSRLCTVTHAENLLPSGAVPQFTMDGGMRRDFGGSNAFWAWQARHYWKFTEDRDFAEAVAPALDTVLAQTFDEHDPDDNLLVGWGLQIGNQEDFVEFYHDGATPSIEVINMMLTRAELAEGLGDTETAQLWRGRAARARALLMKELWIPDLGRMGSYVDQHGKIRLDGQYHTFLYPVIWDIVDELDGYTTLRQVHDRLTGADGEVYCSNNFPNHDNGTWGMQAGAAQQPWAAWAYAKAGQRNQTYRPLLAIATEVMNRNLRGAWPEVMLEHTPAYFTPPVGLFIASVTESLFGLYVDRPAGVLRVSPSFPDAWPEARLDLTRYGADYRRDGNRLTYTVRSADAMRRQLRWSLAPAKDIHVSANGKTLAVNTIPGVHRTIVEAIAPSATETTFEIVWEPIDYRLDYPGSVAEGDTMEVQVAGARVLSVDDRCGVLDTWELHRDGRVTARLKRDLLSAYLPYGRLGQVTFSRRTFFIACEQDGVHFWAPVDITALPPYEGAPSGEMRVTRDGVSVKLLLRSNRSEDIAGRAWLRLARHDIPFSVRLAARAERVFEVFLPANVAGLLSVGDNNARAAMPDGANLPLTLTFKPTQEQEALLTFAQRRLVNLPLPEADRVPYGDWKGLREGSHAGAVPWPGWVEPLTGIETQAVFESPDLPGVRFEVTPGEWVIIGERIGKPYCRLDVQPGFYKKFYLLVATVVDNHDMFTQLGHVTVRHADGVVRARSLYFPGDVDWWDHHGMADTMGTARYARTDRFGLLPQLGPEDSGWDKANPPDLPVHEGLLLGRQRQVAPSWSPPSFPQPEYWATSRVLTTPNCTFNIIEVDLGRPLDVTSIALDTVGLSPGFALYGVVAETTGGMEELEGSPWLPEARFREPKLLCDLSGPSDLTGWTLEGAAFGEAVGVPSLNTLVPAGETATGRALSPAFNLPEAAREIEVEIHGGRNRVVDGEDNLVLRLVDAETGAVLARMAPPGSHTIAVQRMDVREHAGKTVRLELHDENTDTSYAWIGLRKASIIVGD